MDINTKTSQSSNRVKVLVTGGAGFIGSHLVDALLDQNYEVVVIDDLSAGSKDNLNPKAKFKKLNVNSSKLKKVFKAEKPEIVFHLAAQISIHQSTQDPVWDAQQNIIGSINLLENCKNFGVKKVIFSSTAGVYGDTSQVPTPEDHVTNPPSPYGIGKLTTEKYLHYYYQTFGLPYITLRYSNVYGPRQSASGEGGVVAIFSQALSVGQAPTIFGAGSQTRDFVYVKDVVRANILALGAGQVGTYNISTGQETSIKDLAQTIKNLSGSTPEIKSGSARSVDQARSALDFSKAQKELSYTPQVGLEDGLKKTIESFKENYK